MRRFVILVAVCLLAGVFAPVALANGLPPGGTFTDDDLNTHEGNIEAIASVGVTKGCNPAGPLYCPADLVTRGQMASFLARAFNLPATGIDYFSDDGGTTHEGNINRIREAAITTGFPDGTYRPDGFVTRAQMGSFIARAMGLKPIEGDRFADVSGTHAANINAIADAGVTLGCNPAGTLYCPDDFVRRDQMASFIARALRLSPIVPPALVSFGDGIWRVDADIPPGTYRKRTVLQHHDRHHRGIGHRFRERGLQGVEQQAHPSNGHPNESLWSRLLPGRHRSSSRSLAQQRLVGAVLLGTPQRVRLDPRRHHHERFVG